MNEEYDAIVLGTGLKECILSGLLSVNGKKVLHLDRNSYYGADTASPNLTNLWAMFRPGVTPPEQYGHNRDWNVDLIPKFIMANGLLVKLLLHTKVTRYLEWKTVDASFVMQHSAGGMFSSAKNAIHKVPANESEALKSSLMGLFEKKRLRDFYIYLDKVDENNPMSWAPLDLNKLTMQEVYAHFKLSAQTIDFLGHAVALHREDSYLKKPAMDTVKKMILFMESMGKYGDSPYLYPVYGLGGLPESFSRLCAIHGGTYMLNQDVDEILFGEDGKVTGVRSGSDTARAPLVICDPSYVKGLNKTKVTGKVIRAICFLDHPIPSTNNAQSCQIIVPQKQCNRQHDMYITMVSGSHAICKQGLYIAMISTTVETSDPEKEIQPALDLIGPCLEMFTQISDIHEPTNNAAEETLYITKSYDATSHFETSSQDVLAIYEAITGTKLDLNIQPSEEDEY